MKVLIINGFSRTSDGLRAFGRFEAAVRQVTCKQAFRVQKSFAKEEIEFEVVDRDSIDHYLYEMNAGFCSRDAEKVLSTQFFDHLDMVFIDGDATILPWFPKARKVTCSFAMQMFTFLCATNIFVGRIVNGDGKGSQVSAFSKTPKHVLANLEYGDYFLDSATGDIYGYDQPKEEFYPIANASIHSHKAAQENCNSHPAKARIAMLKSFRYVPQNFDEVDRVYLSQMNECSCRILKQYIQHWLSDRLGVSATQYKEFVVNCANAWDVHPVNSNETENIYKVFAESPRGPLIILQRNAVCTQFHVNPRYPETVTLLENFVKTMCERIYSEKKRMDLPLARVAIGGYGKPPIKTSIGPSGGSSGHHFVGTTTVKHSGYAFSKRGGPVLVSNNATTAHIVKAVHEESEGSGSSSESSYSFTMKRSAVRSLERQSNKNKKKIRKLAETRSDPRLRERKTVSPPAASVTDGSGVSWSRQDIREFLHPGYPVETMSPRPHTQLARSPSKASVVVKFTPFRYCRYREFTHSPQSESQTLRSEGSPYIETERVHLQEALMNKERWLVHKGFRTVFRPQTRSDLRLPLSTEPSIPVTQHQFREKAAGTWRV